MAEPSSSSPPAPLQLSQDTATTTGTAAYDGNHRADSGSSHQQQLLQTLASDPAALQREVTRLTGVSGTQQQQLEQLAADLRRAAASEQLEQLTLALLAAADKQSQPPLLLLLDALHGADDTSPLALLRVTTQRLRLNTALEEPERALLLRWGERAVEQLLASQDAAQAAEAARLLLALHDAGGAASFKVATLVWKVREAVDMRMKTRVVDRRNDAC